MEEEIKPEDRASLCENTINVWPIGILCKPFNHMIESGEASRCHCGECKKFTIRKK